MISFILLAVLTVALLGVALYLFLTQKAFGGGLTLIAVCASGYITFLALDTNVAPQVEERNEMIAAKQKKEMERAKFLIAQGRGNELNPSLMAQFSDANIDNMKDLSPKEKEEMKKLMSGIETGKTFEMVNDMMDEASKDMDSGRNGSSTMGAPTAPAYGRSVGP